MVVIAAEAAPTNNRYAPTRQERLQLSAAVRISAVALFLPNSSMNLGSVSKGGW